jgi:anti-sigma regulatory factor (Ser/Thr protein kinase)
VDSAENLNTLVLESIREHADGAEQSDDITMLTFKLVRAPDAVGRPELRVDVVNDLQEIGRVIEAFEAFAGQNDIPPAISQKVGIIVDELLNNTISYGFDEQGEHEFEFTATLGDGVLDLEFSDDGVPFNPFDRVGPDTTLSLDDRDIGGLGLLLVTEMTDTQLYRRQRDRNVITLTINLPATG